MSKIPPKIAKFSIKETEIKRLLFFTCSFGSNENFPKTIN